MWAISVRVAFSRLTSPVVSPVVSLDARRLSSKNVDRPYTLLLGIVTFHFYGKLVEGDALDRFCNRLRLSANALHSWSWVSTADVLRNTEFSLTWSGARNCLLLNDVDFKAGLTDMLDCHRIDRGLEEIVESPSFYCSLSSLIYSLALQPLLRRVKDKECRPPLCRICLPGKGMHRNRSSRVYIVSLPNLPCSAFIWVYRKMKHTVFFVTLGQTSSSSCISTCQMAKHNVYFFCHRKSCFTSCKSIRQMKNNEVATR